MAAVLATASSRERFNMLLMSVFGGAALLLATVGIYGLIRYSAEQRTHELGIRAALGATPGRIRGMVLLQGGALIGIGTAIGLGAAFGLAIFWRRCCSASSRTMGSCFSAFPRHWPRPRWPQSPASRGARDASDPMNALRSE